MQENYGLGDLFVRVSGIEDGLIHSRLCAVVGNGTQLCIRV